MDKSPLPGGKLKLKIKVVASTVSASTMPPRQHPFKPFAGLVEASAKGFGHRTQIIAVIGVVTVLGSMFVLFSFKDQRTTAEILAEAYSANTTLVAGETKKTEHVKQPSVNPPLPQVSHTVNEFADDSVVMGVANQLEAESKPPLPRPDKIEQSDVHGLDSTQTLVEDPDAAALTIARARTETHREPENPNRSEDFDVVLEGEPTQQHIVTVPEQFSSSKVARAQFTNDIERREPIDRLEQVISANGDAAKRVYFFTELQDMRGETVTHRWEHRGQLIAEIQFKIGGNRWRVYSSKNLTSSMTGPWQVVVTNSKDEPIKTSSFVYKSPEPHTLE